MTHLVSRFHRPEVKSEHILKIVSMVLFVSDLTNQKTSYDKLHFNNSTQPISTYYVGLYLNWVLKVG